MTIEWKMDTESKLKDAVTFDDVSLVPRYSEIESRGFVNLTSWLTTHYEIPTPLIASPMSTVVDKDMILALSNEGVAAPIHRFGSISQQIDLAEFAYIATGKKLPVISSIGVGSDAVDNAEKLLDAGANIILIDVAHGDHINVKRVLLALNALSYRSRFDVIAGNIATVEAGRRLESWGADGLRVGIGGGSMCETRVRTGVGIPQLQSIIDIAQNTSVPIISDGGIRSPGDVAKALAAGADTVMIGSLFAGTDEAPGQLIITGEWPNTKAFKVYHGSASLTQKIISGQKAQHVEGTAKIMPAKGPVCDVVSAILEGVRSSMSYLGVDQVRDLREVAEFVRISNAGLIEAHPHGLGN